MKRALVLTLILMLSGAGALWWWLRESLPPLDGEYAVAGLRAPVEVLFDDRGVPHVYAAGPEDAWFAAGVLHARDRFWQMELYRRAASARLSELFGPRTLPIDRRLLTLDLRGAAEAEWKVAPLTVREALTRYAAGVNAEIARHTGRRKPIELQLLGAAPAEWTPLDSLAIGRLLAWRLAENHQGELVRHALAARFGAAEAMRLAGAYPPSGPSVVQGLAGGTGQQGTDTQSGDAAPRSRAHETSASTGERWPPELEWLHPRARRGGSNNWVIAGRRTATGRPLLANDPHLQIELPSVWYEMHLVAAGLDVIGVSLPGTPFVIIGHNARVAWGVTNTGADVQDLFVERLDLTRRQHLFQGQWRPVQVTRREIAVKGGATEVMEIWRTRHGVVFADVGLEWDEAPQWLSPSPERRGERSVFTLRWDIGGEMAGAFEALNRAATWSDFTVAVERFSAPSQNFVYADVDGNIGYAMSGRLPLRAGSAGAMPIDGTAGPADWVGSVQPSSLPRLFNPPRDYIASANNLIDRTWAGVMTHDWAAPYRAARIHRWLESTPRIDVAAAAALQNDVVATASADVLSSVDAALARAGAQGNASAADALSQLRAWDRRADDRPVVTLYHLFEEAFWRRTFADEMGDPLFEGFYEWAGAERPAGLYAILDEPRARWFDDIATLDRRETRDDIAVLAAEDAAARMSGEFRRRQSWGEAHRAHFIHPIGGEWRALGWLFNRGPVAVVGDTYTVNRASHHPLRPFDVWELASWRQIVDVGRWDETLVVLPSGQSGHPLSAHYFDQNELWRTGRYRQQPFSREAVERVRAHRVLFTP